jgi:hypothetical protein
MPLLRGNNLISATSVSGDRRGDLRPKADLDM